MIMSAMSKGARYNYQSDIKAFFTKIPTGTIVDKVKAETGDASLSELFSAALESVHEVHEGLQSRLSIMRMEASLTKVSAVRVRFSKSFARRRQRLSQANVRSTIQRLGRTSKPLA